VGRGYHLGNTKLAAPAKSLEDLSLMPPALGSRPGECELGEELPADDDASRRPLGIAGVDRTLENDRALAKRGVDAREGIPDRFDGPLLESFELVHLPQLRSVGPRTGGRVVQV
jgi:hypothetical protein